MTRVPAGLVWAGLGLVTLVPVIAAASSPLLAWRDPVYIAAGFGGVLSMSLLLFQPLLAGRMLPGLSAILARNLHRAIGFGLVLAVVVHVGGLWITSPPDVVDALLFVSPTPFSAWGVIAMWTLFAAALLGLLRRRLRLRPRLWERGHIVLALVTVLGSVVHALLIEGTMEVMTKVAISALVLIATLKVVIDRQIWAARVSGRA